MNYSHTEIKRKQKRLTDASYKMKYRAGEWLMYFGVVVTITILLMLVFGMAGAVRGLIDKAPKVENFNILALGYTTRLYDSDGNVIQKLDDADRTKEYVEAEQIPLCVQQAFVAAEDRHFFEHHGVNMQGLFFSVYYSVTDEKRKILETRTITQQFVQNQMLGDTNGKGFLEKFSKAVIEQYLAIALEDNLDKPRILEYYLNTISLGMNTTGVQAASKRYFDKEISEVSVSEAAVLAAIVSNPARFNPIQAQETNERRRKDVLKGMLEQEFISEEEYEEALGDDVYLRIQNINNYKSNGKEKTDSYYADAVVEQVANDLKEQLGYSETEAYNALYHEGLQIYTCQEPELQKICDKVINSDKYYPNDVRSYLSYQLVIEKDGRKREYSETNIRNYFLDETGEKISLYFSHPKDAKKYVRTFRKAMLKEGGEILSENIRLVKQPQTSFVLIEQKTGKVAAVVGGRGAKRINRGINRATESKHQPGSALTILSTYVPALDTAGFTLADVEDDTFYQMPEETEEQSDVQYSGLMTIREAIKSGKAVPALKILQKVSVQTGYEFLKKFSFSTLVRQKESEDGQVHSDLQLSLALGEMQEGVTNLELTAAYATLAAGGIYRQPRFYTKVVDRAGNVLLENKIQGNRVIKEETAWLLTNTMQEVVSQGTVGEAAFDGMKMPVAGYGGSTGGNTDFWFEGYTPYYTAGIWSGMDENLSQEASKYHMVIWKEIMEQVHAKMKKTKGSFHQPETIILRKICNKCGNLAVEGICNEAEGGTAVRKEFFDTGTEPEQNCTCHVRYAFCRESGGLAAEECPEEDVFYRVLLKKTEKAVTDDSKYTVMQNINKEICNIHGK